MESSSKPPFLLCSKLHTGSYRIRRYQQSHKKENKMSRIADITGHKASSQVPKTHVLPKNPNEKNQYFHFPVNKLIFHRLKVLKDKLE